MDTIAKIKTYEFEASFGKNCLEKLKGFNVIFRSPSCLPTRPELKQEADRGAIVTTEVEMLMEMCPCKIIGITGSDGKTTTTSLINAILQHAGYKKFLGGNIGIPLFTKISEMTPEDFVVLELSSFQLMNMKIHMYLFYVLFQMVFLPLLFHQILLLVLFGYISILTMANY